MIWQCRDFALSLDRVRVMGIVNVTPDSFSDGGKWCDVATAVAHGLKLVEEGADLVDVGGESSRPGAVEVPVEEELRRVLPVVKELAARGARVSVDTRRAEVARQALDAGACAVNDVTAGADERMFEVVRDARAGMVLMRGWKADMECGDLSPLSIECKAAINRRTPYYLAQRVSAALDAGIAREALVIDPGVGFTNNAEEDAALLRGIDRFSKIAPVMVGVSRKRFIGKISGEAEPSQRLGGSLAAALFAVSRGARIVRAHDVAATAQALKVWGELNHGE